MPSAHEFHGRVSAVPPKVEGKHARIGVRRSEMLYEDVVCVLKATGQVVFRFVAGGPAYTEIDADTFLDTLRELRESPYVEARDEDSE